MKVAPNFDIREFVPESIWKVWGARSIWFINKQIIELAQFYKIFFTAHFKAVYPNVDHVIIRINDWHYGGSKQHSGFRPFDYILALVKAGKKVARLSQHCLGNAFDCEIIIVFKDGTRKEANYKYVARVIQANWKEFKAAGLTTIENPEDTPGWLHSDCRNTGQEDLLIVNA